MSEATREKAETGARAIADAAMRDLREALDGAGVLLSERVLCIIEAQVRRLAGSIVNGLAHTVEAATKAGIALGAERPTVSTMHLLILAGITGSKAEAVRVMKEKESGEVSGETYTTLINSVGILSQFAEK